MFHLDRTVWVTDERRSYVWNSVNGVDLDSGITLITVTISIFCSNVHMLFVTNLISSFCLFSFERVYNFFCFVSNSFQMGLIIVPLSVCAALGWKFGDDICANTPILSISNCCKLICESFLSDYRFDVIKNIKSNAPNRIDLLLLIFCAYRLHFKVEPKIESHIRT